MQSTRSVAAAYSRRESATLSLSSPWLDPGRAVPGMRPWRCGTRTSLPSQIIGSPGAAVAEEVIYQRLEDGKGIGEFERHDKILQMSQWGVNGYLPFVPISDLRQIIGVAKVEFREDLCLVEWGKRPKTAFFNSLQVLRVSS